MKALGGFGRHNRVTSVLKVMTVVALTVTASCKDRPEPPLRFPPVVVTSALRVSPVLVRGGQLRVLNGRYKTVRYGDPLSVLVTEYCLRGTTRRGRYVRAGIVAADPQVFPLARYVELYIGGKYAGRFLVDDTGGRIKGRHIDVWTPDCNEASRFGLQHGTAVAIAGAELQIRQTGAPATGPLAPRRKPTKHKP